MSWFYRGLRSVDSSRFGFRARGARSVRSSVQSSESSVSCLGREFCESCFEVRDSGVHACVDAWDREWHHTVRRMEHMAEVRNRT